MFVNKKEGSLWPCVDYRAFHEVTKKIALCDHLSDTQWINYIERNTLLSSISRKHTIM